MLKTVWLTEKRNTELGTAILLGGFDGLHVGHRQLLSRAKESGLPVGIMTIVGGKGSKNIFTFSERERIFLESGADFVFELPFSEIKDLSPEQFLSVLTKEFTPKLFVCGEDFRFGAKAIGNVETIKRATHVCVDAQPLVELEGEKVSTSVIKERLSFGKMESVTKLLGHPFFLKGEVFKDRQIGRTIGFPTANVRYPSEKYPLRKGVYETLTETDEGVYKGITNYGARPTFSNADVLTETYLDGYSGNLYGKTVTVKFTRFLREIEKFESVEKLKEQLTEDIRRVREND